MGCVTVMGSYACLQVICVGFVLVPQILFVGLHIGQCYLVISGFDMVCNAGYGLMITCFCCISVRAH